MSAQDALWQAGKLMLPPPLGEGIAQLPACVAGDAGGDAELMFGPALPGAASTEADAWLVWPGLHEAAPSFDGTLGCCVYCTNPPQGILFHHVCTYGRSQAALCCMQPHP